MKHLLKCLLQATAICYSLSCIAQSNWGSWITVYSEGSKAIQISFRYSKYGNTCYPKGGGYHFYRIKNDFDEKAGGTILFDNTDCDGKNYTNSAPFYFQNAGIDEEMGQWFLGQSGVRNIRLRAAPDFYERKKNTVKSGTDENSGKRDEKPTLVGEGGTKNTLMPGAGTTGSNGNNEERTGGTKSGVKTTSNARTTAKANEEIEKEIQDARMQYIKDSINATWQERNNRVENHTRQQNEKAAIAAGMTAGAAALLLSDANNSRLNGKHTYFKFSGSLGMNSVPVNENMESSEVSYMNYTSVKNFSPFLGEAELQATLYRSEWFSLKVSPFAQYGVTFFAGDNGSYYSYGGRGEITFGRKLRLYAMAGYEDRTGENTYDNDAAMENVGLITNSKAVGTLSFNYNIISYGGGIFFDTNAKNSNNPEDKYIQLGAIVHKPSLTSNGSGTAATTLIGGQLKIVLGGGFTIAGEYIPNYPVAGEAIHTPDSDGKPTYWFAKIGKTFNLSSSK